MLTAVKISIIIIEGAVTDGKAASPHKEGCDPPYKTPLKGGVLMDTINTIINFLSFIGTYIGLVVQLCIHLHNKKTKTQK